MCLGQSREITDRIYTLNEEIEELNLQLGKQRKQLAEAKEELAEVEGRSSVFKILSLVLAVVVAGLIFYIRKSR